MTDARREGYGLSVMDGWIGAEAQSHGLTLVTGNTKDFQHAKIALFDPWPAASA